jgi:UDP-glucose 4-epimerase
LQHKDASKHSNLTLINGNILDQDHLASSMKGSDLVVHCAAIAGIDTVIISPVKTMQVNMIGTYHVLEAASKLENVERVVCFSTSEVFGQYAFLSQRNRQHRHGHGG